MQTFLYKVNRLFCLFIVLSNFATVAVSGQTFMASPMKEMPEAVSNNAVTSAMVGEVPFVYSFGGIDSTKLFSGIHLRSYRLQTNTNLWEALPPLPDTLGKIGVAASTVKNRIYIMGGYHVLSSGAEVTSNKVHVFDPQLNTFLPDAMPMPVPVDDHVQVVWRDSLIYVITGWSNNNNVANVQLFNPASNSWQIATPVPNNSNFKVFGASGVIVGDTIYYAGGAEFGAAFPLGTSFRKGAINANDPTQITWIADENLSFSGYRMGASSYVNKPIWFGGALVSYNYDGIAYNGSGGVPAIDRIQIYQPNSNQINSIFGVMPSLMDLRGVAKIAPNQFIIAGGMGASQITSRKTLLLTVQDYVGMLEQSNLPLVRLYPYPARNVLMVDSPKAAILRLYNLPGDCVLNQLVERYKQTIDVSHLPEGLYVAELQFSDSQVLQYQRVAIFR